MYRKPNLSFQMKIKLYQKALASIPLSLARPYLKLFNRARYAEVFNKYGEGKKSDKFRIYIPITSKELLRPKQLTPPEALVDYLKSLGMRVDSYAAGTCFLPDGKRTARIGKVVAKNPAIKHLYDSDPQRASTKSVSAWVVISRHPYDILGMSFDRGWTSCMHLTVGLHRSYLKSDIEHGTLVAYLIKETDKNINSPSARIAIKPYENSTNLLLLPGVVYGTAPEAFSELVLKFCTYMNSGAPAGQYRLVKEVYADEMSTRIFHVSDDMNPAELSSSDKELLISDSNTSGKILRELSIDSVAERRRRVAEHKNTPKEILLKLSFDTSADVRLAVASNDNAPEEALLRLLEDEQTVVRKRVVRNANLPSSCSIKILNGTDETSQRLLLDGNAIIPENALLSFIDRKFKDSIGSSGLYLIASVISRTRSAVCLHLTTEHLLSFDTKSSGVLTKKNNCFEELAINPATSAADIRTLYDRQGSNELLIRYIAGRVNLTPDMLAELSKNKFVSVRQALVRNDRLPASVAFEIAATEKNPVVLYSLAATESEYRSDTSLEAHLLEILAENLACNSDCFNVILSYKTCPAHVLAALAPKLATNYAIVELVEHVNVALSTLIYIANEAVSPDVAFALIQVSKNDPGILIPIFKLCLTNTHKFEVPLSAILDIDNLDTSVLALLRNVLDNTEIKGSSYMRQKLKAYFVEHSS